MNLPDLKQLKKIIALCRAQGVKSIEIDNVKLTLSDDAPVVRSRSPKQSAKVTAPSTDTLDEDGWDNLTEEQKLFYSAGAIPDTLGGTE